VLLVVCGGNPFPVVAADAAAGIARELLALLLLLTPLRSLMWLLMLMLLAGVAAAAADADAAAVAAAVAAAPLMLMLMLMLLH
jgi:hypothetical protein